MKPRERFCRSLTFQPVDRPARTDMFCLVEELFGESFPPEADLTRGTPELRRATRERYVALYERIGRELGHDAIIVWQPFTGPANLDVIAALRERIGDERAIIGFASPFWGMERITDHEAFAERVYNDRAGLLDEARRFCAEGVERAQALARAGADVVYVPNDVAFNGGPYFSPDVFDELVTPFAREFYGEVRRLGLLGVYHSDGNLMKLLDTIMSFGAHALQSIDPMAGMDIKVVKALTAGSLALIGNVQCNLLQDGPEEAIRRSARYCLEHGSPGSGYVFMASNSIFDGCPLANYRIMQDEYMRFCQEGNHHG
jgi:uroporphyrinogen decarboxylase